MAAITSIKDPLVNLNTDAHRQTHVDLQQRFEDIHNFTWWAQTLWSISNIVPDKKWENVEWDFSSVSTFHTCQQPKPRQTSAPIGVNGVNIASHPPGRCGHSSEAELRGSRWGPSLWTPLQNCWHPAHPESLAWKGQEPSSLPSPPS